MKKFFLFFLIYQIFINAGFTPETLVLMGNNIFNKIKYISCVDHIACFNSYYERTSFQISLLYPYESSIGVCLVFGATRLVCDPQQLFRLYKNGQWIRACDIEKNCLLIDVNLKPVMVTNAWLINMPFLFYKFNVPAIGYHNFFVTDLCINTGNY